MSFPDVSVVAVEVAEVLMEVVALVEADELIDVDNVVVAVVVPVVDAVVD